MLKLFCFLLAHCYIFLIIICFSGSSINAKKKFWGALHLLHMCVIFLKSLVFFVWIYILRKCKILVEAAELVQLTKFKIIEYSLPHG